MERRPRHTTKKTHTTRTDTDRDTQRAHREDTRRRDGYNKRHVALLAPPTTSSLHDASYSRRIVVVVPLVVPTCSTKDQRRNSTQVMGELLSKEATSTLRSYPDSTT